MRFKPLARTLLLGCWLSPAISWAQDTSEPPTEEAPADASEDTPTEEPPAEELPAEELPVEEPPVEEPPVEEPPADEPVDSSEDPSKDVDLTEEKISEFLLEMMKEDGDSRQSFWFRPVMGWRWLSDVEGSAFVLGLNTGILQQLNDPSRKVGLGVGSRVRYEGAMGDARGRTLMTDGRLVMNTDFVCVQLGGGLVANRHLFENTEPLSGMLGAAGDVRINIDIASFHVFAGARPTFFLTGDRLARTDGPLLGVGDELSHMLGARIFFVAATWTRTYTAAGPIEMIIIGLEH